MKLKVDEHKIHDSIVSIILIGYYTLEQVKQFNKTTYVVTNKFGITGKLK